MEIDVRETRVGPVGVNPNRARAAVRDLFERQILQRRDLMAPLLVHRAGPEPAALPGHVSIRDVAAEVRRLSAAGIRGVKVFAFGSPRNERASAALAPDNLMIAAVGEVKGACPQMVVTTEVCGCSWTDHGECALLGQDGRIDLAGTFELMGEMALMHAQAGADVVSPTAMLEGSVLAVREALTWAGLPDVGVCPNIALHTGLYEPFKRLMTTNPGRGHRRGLQLEPGRADRDAIAQLAAWMREGADSVTLQPVMTAVDVLVRLRAHTPVPLIAYSTSGEYIALAALGPQVTLEYHAALKRAGADLILTFAAEQVANTLP